MVITIVDAVVAEPEWGNLKMAYGRETGDLPAAVLQTFLIQSQGDPTSWRIVTHWRSQDDLDEMRRQTSVPVAIKVFREVGAQPSVGLWNIATHRAASS